MGETPQELEDNSKRINRSDKSRFYFHYNDWSQVLSAPWEAHIEDCVQSKVQAVVELICGATTTPKCALKSTNLYKCRYKILVCQHNIGQVRFG